MSSLEILKIHTRERSLADDVDLKALAKAAEGMAGSDIEAIARRALMLAIREFVNQEKEDLNIFQIENRIFQGGT